MGGRPSNDSCLHSNGFLLNHSSSQLPCQFGNESGEPKKIKFFVWLRSDNEDVEKSENRETISIQSHSGNLQREIQPTSFRAGVCLSHPIFYYRKGTGVLRNYKS